jgi:hypothetical protein
MDAAEDSIAGDTDRLVDAVLQQILGEVLVLGPAKL